VSALEEQTHQLRKRALAATPESERKALDAAATRAFDAAWDAEKPSNERAVKARDAMREVYRKALGEVRP
jgi:hypothetical protein